MILAIDTATRILSIALHDGDALLAECTLVVDRNHGTILAALVERTLAQCGFGPNDISALAVCVGPGSYTGLRIGVALAKGMAAAGNLPLAPVTTLDIIASAEDRATGDESMIVTVPAGRNRVIWAAYRYQLGGWRAESATKLGDWDDLLDACAGPCRLTGDINAAGLQRVQMARDDGRDIHVTTPAKRLRRAGFLAEIAWEQLRRDGAAAYPADQVRPIYLKSPG